MLVLLRRLAELALRRKVHLREVQLLHYLLVAHFLFVENYLRRHYFRAVVELQKLENLLRDRLHNRQHHQHPLHLLGKKVLNLVRLVQPVQLADDVVEDDLAVHLLKGAVDNNINTLHKQELVHLKILLKLRVVEQLRL